MHRDIEQKWNNFGETYPALLTGGTFRLTGGCQQFHSRALRM